jgi:peptidyl-prolyl cis-trans isomerase SurA
MAWKISQKLERKLDKIKDKSTQHNSSRFLIFTPFLVKIRSPLATINPNLAIIERAMNNQLSRTVIHLLIAAVVMLSGCGRHTSEALLAEVGPEKLYISDFERMLVKNNGGWEAAKNTPLPEREKFLNLMVKYRLKVLDAYRQGLDKDEEISKEMQQYAKSLSASLLFDKEIVKPGLRQMYERRKEELRASHILLRLSPEAAPEDTLKVWQRAADIVKRAQSGEDFAKLAAEYSEDYSNKSNGGDIYYFTSGFMVPPFEDACYQLTPGQIFPQPVRTEFGYHIIKLTDRKLNRGQIRASHIMIRFETASPSPEDTLKAYGRIKEIQDSLRAGKDFADLAFNSSEDMGSAFKGGDLGFFERRKTIQSFDEAAFSLKVGEVSGIVRTPYGYHLIKVTEEKPVPPFSEMKQTLREAFQNSRYTYEYENLLRRYKTETNFTIHQDTVDRLLSRADSTKHFSDETWDRDITAVDRRKPVISFAGETVDLDSVLRGMKSDSEFKNMELKPANIAKALDRIGERALIHYKTQNIESDSPEFRRTLKEYEEGILLYKSEQQHVWSKITTNDSLLRDYFEKHRDRYTTPHKVSFTEVLLLSDSAHALQLLDSVKAGADFNALAIRHTDRPNVEKHKGEWVDRSADENALTRRAAAMKVGEVSDPIRYEGGYSIIKVTANEPPRPKTYEEAATEVAGQYHDYISNYLEEEWMKALREEFKVVVQPEKLRTAFTATSEEKEE